MSKQQERICILCSTRYFGAPLSFCNACEIANQAPVGGEAKQGPTLFSGDPEGVRKDDGKPSMGLIPPEAELAEAHVWGYGATKYGLHNWRKGMSITRILSCLQRHLTAIKQGEDYDPETKQPHAAHIRTNAAMLIAFLDRPELDDRYKKPGAE